MCVRTPQFVDLLLGIKYFKVCQWWNLLKKMNALSDALCRAQDELKREMANLNTQKAQFKTDADQLNIQKNQLNADADQHKSENAQLKQKIIHLLQKQVTNSKQELHCFREGKCPPPNQNMSIQLELLNSLLFIQQMEVGTNEFKKEIDSLAKNTFKRLSNFEI